MGTILGRCVLIYRGSDYGVNTVRVSRSRVGSKQARTNSNKQCWGRKVENRERFACIEAGDCQGGCGLKQ